MRYELSNSAISLIMFTTPLLVFDDDCYVCQKSVRFLDWVTTQPIYLTNRSDFLRGILAEEFIHANNFPDSLLYIDDRFLLSGWDALLAILKNGKLSILSAIGKLIIPNRLGNYCYDIFASHRHFIRFKKNKCQPYLFKRLRPVKIST